MTSEKAMSVSIHRVKMDELKLKARVHNSTHWIIIEFDDNHEVTLFMNSLEDYKTLVDLFQITDEEITR